MNRIQEELIDSLGLMADLIWTIYGVEFLNYQVRNLGSCTGCLSER